MKKILLLTLALIALLSLMYVCANAATYGDLTYAVSDGEITITECNTSFTGNLDIPSEINGYPVTTIGNSAFAECTGLTSVTIPDSVTAICDNAFSYCYELSNVTFGSGVTTIGINAFYGCWGLYEITIPDGVTTIGDNAFGFCEGLYSVVLPDSVTTMGDSVFSSSTALSNVILGNGITIIGDDTFSNCNFLENIIIPDSVATIGNRAFDGCWSLVSITIPDGVTSIGKEVFSSCFSLKSITVSGGNKNYLSENGVLFDKNKNTLIRYPAGKTDASYTVPDGVAIIDEGAFNCTRLTNITIPYSVTTIGKSAFSTNDYAYDSCDITDVYYNGTEEWWEKLVVERYNEMLLNATIHFKEAVVQVQINKAISTDNSLKYISEISIEGEPKILSFGTTFIPLWLFETGSTNVATVTYDNSNYNIQNGQTFGATLSGVPAQAKDMLIVGKSFVKDEDGNYVWSSTKTASVNEPTLTEIK